MKKRDQIINSGNHSRPRKYRVLRVLLVIAVLLITIRLSLPYLILHFVNKRLAALNGYYGYVEDINLALVCGAYVIRGIEIKKVSKTGQDTTRFFSAPRIDLSLEWRELFNGKIVGEVVFEQPVINYVKSKTVGRKAEKSSTDFIQLVKDFMPVRINRFAVENGEIHYIDRETDPKVDIFLSYFNVEGRGFTNEPEEGVALPASIVMSSNLYGGNLSMNIRLDPLSRRPAFDMNGELTETDLTRLNNFFKAYGKFDVERGRMSVYAEFAARNNRFKGYVKPLNRDIKIVKLKDEEGNVLQIAWEIFVGTVAEIFENQPRDQLATRIPLEGRFSNPNVDLFEAVLALLKNAFIKALEPTIEETIELKDAAAVQPEKKEGLLKRIFDGDDREDGKTDKKEKK